MDHAWSIFLTTHAVLVELMEERLAAANLPSLAWYDALWALDRAPGNRLRLHEMANHMVLSRSNLTRLIDRLETAGYVKRERSDVDRRGAFALLTEAGAHMRKTMWPVYRTAIDELFRTHLSAREAEALEGMLKRILKAARDSGIAPKTAIADAKP